MDNEADEIKKQPWQEAMEAFLQANFKQGAVITHAWFYRALGVEQPTDSMPYVEGKRLELERLPQMILLKKNLLEQHRICLKAAPGRQGSHGGYRWVPAREQANHAARDFDRSVKKAIDQSLQIATCVDLAGLSAAERTHQRSIADHIRRTQAHAKLDRRLAMRAVREQLRSHRGPDEQRADSA